MHKRGVYLICPSPNELVFRHIIRDGVHIIGQVIKAARAVPEERGGEVIFYILFGSG